MDLTPYFVDEPFFTRFHHRLKNICDRFHPEWYPRMKEECDSYFYLLHRQEHRGIGGIFFDDLNELPFDVQFEFIKQAMEVFFTEYVVYFMSRQCCEKFTEEEREWQLVRRGRYAEFNLIYDRGTKFGLSTPGCRIESVFCSLPLECVSVLIGFNVLNRGMSRH